MAVPVAAIKAAVAALKDKRVRKKAGKMVAATVGIPVFVMVLLVGLLSATTEHNNAAVKLCFNNEAIPAELPDEYADHIKSMRACFKVIDTAIAQLPLEGELNDIRVKSVFYALNFDTPLHVFTNRDAATFVDCFVRYEIRTDYIETTDENGDTVIEEIEYTVAVPVGLTAAYINLTAAGFDSTELQRDNAAAIYRIITGGSGFFDGMGASVNMSDAELYELATYYGVTLPDVDVLSVERRNVLKAAFAGVEINIPYHTGHTHGLEDEYIEQEVHRRLEKAIATLSDEEQSLLREIFYEGKTEREIAQSLGISQVGVHKRKEKILARLKIFLES